MIAAFRATVERFRDESAVLDGSASAVLDRLVAEEWWRHVRPALELVPAEKWPRLLSTCVEAERVARTHARVADRLRRRANGAEKAAKALLTVKRFLAPASDGPIVRGARHAQDRDQGRAPHRPAGADSSGARPTPPRPAPPASACSPRRSEPPPAGATGGIVADFAAAVFNLATDVTDRHGQARHDAGGPARSMALPPSMRWTTVAARSAPKKVPERAV